MTDIKACAHKRTDWSWSHGNLERCLDCGAVADPEWTNPVQRFYDAVNAGNQPAAYHMARYLENGKKDGLPYPVRVRS